VQKKKTLNPYKFEGDDPDAISPQEQAYNELYAYMWDSGLGGVLGGLKTPQQIENAIQQMPVGKPFKK